MKLTGSCWRERCQDTAREAGHWLRQWQPTAGCCFFFSFPLGGGGSGGGGGKRVQKDAAGRAVGVELEEITTTVGCQGGVRGRLECV